LLIYNLPWKIREWGWKERKAVAICDLPWRIGGGWKERKVVADLQLPAGGLESGDGRKGKWLLIYNLLWRMEGGDGRKEKWLLIYNLPWRIDIKGKESGC
jgi:hypothetical protein